MGYKSDNIFRKNTNKGNKSPWEIVSGERYKDVGVVMIEPHIIDRVAIEWAKEEMGKKENKLSYNLPDHVVFLITSTVETILSY